MCEHQEKVKTKAMTILAAKGNDVAKLTVVDLTVLLTWHQHAKVATMEKAEKLVVWVTIVGNGKVPPSFEKWTSFDKAQLLEAQSDIVEMTHTALGYLERRN